MSNSLQPYLWTVARQAPLSMGFSRQEYWCGLPCPPPGNLPDLRIKSTSLSSPALAGRFFTISTTWYITAVPIYIPANSVGRFPSLPTLASICRLWIFLWWPSSSLGGSESALEEKSKHHLAFCGIFLYETLPLYNGTLLGIALPIKVFLHHHPRHNEGFRFKVI